MGKKIVFLADCLITQKAGIHYYAKQFIQRAIDAYPDNEYYLVVPKTYGEFDIKEIVIPINASIPLHLRLRNVWHMPNIINKLAPDVVIEMAHFGPFRLDSAIKRVTVIHDLTPILFPQWHDKASHYIHRIFLIKILSNANVIIANSQVTKQALIDYYPSTREKIEVSYPSLIIDTEHTERNKINHSYFLSVGTLEPRKNHTQLISAFEIIASQNADIKLIIVGFKGWKSDPLYDKINNSKYTDRILIKGYIDEVELIELYNGALALVFPSLYEGFGIPLLESMTFGTLVICSDIPICREVCGDAALYYNGVEALASHMESVLLDPSEYAENKRKGLERSHQINTASLDLHAIFG